MLKLYNTNKQNLPDLAQCHRDCFPDSLASKLGKAYVQQTFHWYLHHPNRFLFHLQEGNRIVGYLGGFVPARPGDGSSSGMLQHAFSQAVKGLLLKPWLLFHAEVVPHYPFLWRNIKRKITGRETPAQNKTAHPVVFKPYCGLVVIGVHPACRGRGVAQELMKEFEKRAVRLQQPDLVLTVKKNNTAALRAYEKSGWYVAEEQPITYVMRKHLAVAEQVKR